jgi:uncharacterized membrane protein
MTGRSGPSATPGLTLLAITTTGRTQDMGLFDITKRAELLGLPIGPKQTDWDKVARFGASAAAAAASVAAARSLKEPLTRVVGKGRKAVEQANGVATTIRQAAQGAAGSSTGIGSMLGAFRAVGSDEEEGVDGDGGGTANLTKLRLIISEQIDVGVPRRTAYNQWTQFEDFPMVFKAVEGVEQEEDEELAWRGKIGPSRRQWKAEIVEQVPDERIAWTSTSGVKHQGVVTFHRLDDNLTRVQLEMEYTPQGFVEKVGNIFLTVRMRVRRGLRLYKHFIELRRDETGAWRGEIEGDGIGKEHQDLDDEAGERRERDGGRDRATG